MKVGDRLEIRRKVRDIKDPATGKILRSIDDKVGDVDDHGSRCDVLSRRLHRQLSGQSRGCGQERSVSSRGEREERKHMNSNIGDRIGDYEIVGMLGAGGMGKVYKVRNVISDRVEAMKVLLPDLANVPELADRFMREIKVLAGLEHPNIAALRTAQRIDNQLVMVMELVEGVTLQDRLEQGRLPVPEALEYIAQVLSALSYAHARGVIHRDIKPANMMVTAGGAVKLMDFGIAKAAGDRKLTMTGTTMGSLYYMSPEQIKGAASWIARSDLYSFGVSLYELVTGARPFHGDSDFSIMSAHLESEPVPPIDVDPQLPAALNEIILLSIAKDPAKRFQSADAFRSALGSVSGGAPVPAPAAAPQAAQTFAAVRSAGDRCSGQPAGPRGTNSTPAFRSSRPLHHTGRGLGYGGPRGWRNAASQVAQDAGGRDRDSRAARGPGDAGRTASHRAACPGCPGPGR